MKNLDIPPIWLIGSAAASWLLTQFLPVLMINFPNWLGWVVAVLGLSWAVSANVLLARAKTTVDPRKKPTTLVVNFSFKVNRNPIYTGMTIMLLGWAVVLGAITAFLPVIAFPIIISRRFIPKEEQSLLEAFGDEAVEYLRSTRRW